MGGGEGGLEGFDKSMPLKLKPDNNGNIAKYKARLVCQGITLEEDIDYTGTFAPVIRYESVRSLLALSEECDVRQMEVGTAFLNDELDEGVYMELPRGFGYDKESTTVCRRRKSLYGLKQARLCWYEVMKQALMNSAENGTYSKRENWWKVCAIGLFVDDLLCCFMQWPKPLGTNKV